MEHGPSVLYRQSGPLHGFGHRVKTQVFWKMEKKLSAKDRENFATVLKLLYILHEFFKKIPKHPENVPKILVRQ